MQRGEYEKAREVGDASGKTVGIVVADFNSDITGAMLAGALATLKEWKIKDEDVRVLHVPGSFELPYGAQRLMKEGRYDALVAIGCVIKGETDHDRYIAQAATEGLIRVSLDFHVPLGFGVITVNDLAQAVARSSGKENKGSEAAHAALSVLLS